MNHSYMIFRMTWNAERNKYDKKPVGLHGEALLKDSGEPPQSHDATALLNTIRVLGTPSPTQPGYCLGKRLHATESRFCFDLDEVVDASTGEVSVDAHALMAPFIQAGCYYERSSSGRGFHIIGRYTGELPPHATSRPSVHKYEFYTKQRGIALNVTSNQGSMDVDATALVLTLLRDVFPARVVVTVPGALGSGPRADWKGPTDDDELLRRALAATGSAAARFGGKATFRQLWEGTVPHDSHHDMALASHLAFWTGCDIERVLRLMWRSGMVREKWTEHKTYLREWTAQTACTTTATVYREPERVDVAAKFLGAPRVVIPQAPAAPLQGELLPASPDDKKAVHKLTDDTITTINGLGTLAELETLIETVGALGLPKLHAERVVNTLKKKLEIFGSGASVSQLRQLVSPPIVRQDTAIPEWIQQIVYVKRGDFFYAIHTSSEYSHESFRMEFTRLMPLRPTGQRDDPVVAARERWNIVTVDDLIYRPDQPLLFQWAGLNCANKFNPASFPPLTVASEEATTCINLLQRHLYDVVDKRDNLYTLLLCWIAHNVQKPGHKIRWSPLLKGIGGDGKSIFGELLFSVMGETNVKMTSNSTLSNKGGFTDWSTGAAVNIIEEIRLEGKDKRSLYNAMKIFVGDDRIELNSKGTKSAVRALRNVTNHWANSNHGDAAPIDDSDRRWLIIFTPWESKEEAAIVKGYANNANHELQKHFERIGSSIRKEPGAWRSWLLGIDLSGFNPNAPAEETPEREAMKQASRDVNESAIQDCINAKSPGVCKEAFCSASLMGKVEIETREKPSNNSWNRILTDLGYRQYPRPLWWNGRTRRIWTRKVLDEESIKTILTATLSM